MGILDAPAPRGYRSSIFQGMPPVTSRPNGFTMHSGIGANLSNGTDTSANFRSVHQVLQDCTDFRLVYGNFHSGGAPFTGDGPNNIFVKASVEFPTVTALGGTGQVGQKQPIYFGNVRTVTIAPGAFAVSDPVPLSLVTGRYLYVRTYVSVANVGEKWPQDLYTDPLRSEGVTKGAPATDISDSATGITTAGQAAYTPVAIIANLKSGRSKVISLVGDSILYGSGDNQPNGLGFGVRACLAAGVPYINVAKGGEKAADVNTERGFSRRMAMTAGCTSVLYAYGHNDWFGNVTAAQLQADTLAIWGFYAARNIPVRAITLTPDTTTTDGWASTANQTVRANEAARTTYNDWLRDGAPILAGVAVAAGSSAGGTLRAGASGHPLAGYFEVADAVESARNSGKWKVGTLRTVTDGSMGASSGTFTSATAAFTSADVGKTIAITGAGAAGAALTAYIAGVTNATTISLGSNSTTAVSGATAKIGDIYTADGTHPTPVGHIAIQAVINLAVMA